MGRKRSAYAPVSERAVDGTLRVWGGGGDGGIAGLGDARKRCGSGDVQTDRICKRWVGITVGLMKPAVEEPD
jgi:hypothetical protein